MSTPIPGNVYTDPTGMQELLQCAEHARKRSFHRPQGAQKGFTEEMMPKLALKGRFARKDDGPCRRNGRAKALKGGFFQLF